MADIKLVRKDGGEGTKTLPESYLTTDRISSLEKQGWVKESSLTLQKQIAEAEAKKTGKTTGK